MDEKVVLDIKDTYYEYISKISEGLLIIANNLRMQEYDQAFNDIIKFTEGLQWLISVESLLKKNNYTIKSRISEANEYMIEVNEAIENQDYVLVADLFEYELSPLFSSASEWIFKKE